MTNLPSPPADDKKSSFPTSHHHNSNNSYYYHYQSFDDCLLYSPNNNYDTTITPQLQEQPPEYINQLSNDQLATSPPLTLNHEEEEERDDSWYHGNDNVLIQGSNFYNPDIVFEWQSFQDIQHFLTDAGGIIASPTTTITTKKAASQEEEGDSFLFNNTQKKNDPPTTMDLFHPHHHHHHHGVPRPGFYLQQTDVTNMQFLSLLLDRAASHWCCIGFKIAPIQLDFVRYHTLPISILYCIAAISLVSDPDQQQFSTHAKDMAITLYQKARQYVDDVFFDDVEEQLSPRMIQSYFCLSYTSNLLRLYDHQRTWAAMAAIALQRQFQQKQILRQRTIMTEQQKHIEDSDWLSCWHRWYYVDAWMSLTLHRQRLLPDDVMEDNTNHFLLFDDQQQQQQSFTSHQSNSLKQANYLHHFAILAHFIRRYLRAFESHQLTSITSPIYYQITEALEAWYDQLPYDTQTNPIPHRPHHYQFNPRVDIHLHLCYYAVRLVIFSRFLEQHEQNNPSMMTSKILLIHNTLETNLQLLQALQYLKENKCDQSTYHHLFLTIHNAALSVYQKLVDNNNNSDNRNLTRTTVVYQQKEENEQYYNKEKLRTIAGEQLLMNLALLKSTAAYFNDTFNMRSFATQCMDQIKYLDLFKENSQYSSSSSSSSSSSPSAIITTRTIDMNLKNDELLERTRHISSASPFISVFRARDLDPSELRKTTLRKKRE
ncbi:hypothetical protein BDA99DRAFT_491692 [Phascolomyces articulosus]|uniref:Transcription factor domain-containing protein n=1 Tax=Phascolomyces articulosus TaxID=60185 RepID=A0AAD5KC66_9FUNG|nr:hypothetical protein BDA99DRAFT_491692 [Phascolomyces articulosus]